MASPELLAALSQQLPYYLQKPDRPPNIGAAAVHAFLAIRTPVAMEKYRAQLRALDPSARMAFMAQMARIRADERNNYRAALVDLERTSAKASGDAMEMAKAKLQFAQSMSHDRTQAAIANTNAQVEMSKFATVRTDEGRKFRQKMMDDIGRTGDDIARLMNEADAAEAAGDVAGAEALDNEAEARRMELAASLRRSWSAAQQGLDGGELRGLSADLTAAMGQGIAGTDPESTVAIGSIVHSVVPQMQREGITQAGSPGASSLQGFVDFASQVIGAPPQQVASRFYQQQAASAGGPAAGAAGGGAQPAPPGGPVGGAVPGAGSPPPGGAPPPSPLPPGTTRQTTTRLSRSANLPGIPDQPSIEQLASGFDPSLSVGLPGDPLPATLRAGSSGRSSRRTPAGSTRQAGGQSGQGFKLKDLVRRKLPERAEVEQPPAPESLITEDQAKKAFGRDADTLLDRRRGDITAEQAFERTSTLGPGMQPLRAGGPPGQFAPEELGFKPRRPPPAEEEKPARKSAGKSKVKQPLGESRDLTPEEDAAVRALIDEAAPPQSEQDPLADEPGTSQQEPDEVQRTLDRALKPQSGQSDEEPSLERLVSSSRPNANPNIQPDPVGSAERAADAKRRELMARAAGSEPALAAGRAAGKAGEAAGEFLSTAREGMGKTAGVAKDVARTGFETAASVFPNVSTESTLGQLVGARSPDKKAPPKKTADEAEASAMADERARSEESDRRKLGEAEFRNPSKPNPDLRAGIGAITRPKKGVTMEEGVREPKDEEPGDTGFEPDLAQLVGGEGVVETAAARRRRLEEERRRREEMRRQGG